MIKFNDKMGFFRSLLFKRSERVFFFAAGTLLIWSVVFYYIGSVMDGVVYALAYSDLVEKIQLSLELSEMGRRITVLQLFLLTDDYGYIFYGDVFIEAVGLLFLLAFGVDG